MPIQHRNIIDEERHEVKGADTALSGTVPVADGVGSTNFQRIGIGQMSGSLPTSVPGLTLVTDGSGGFTTTQPIYARLSTVHPTTPTWITSIIFASSTGFVTDGSAVLVTYPGYYWYSIEMLNPITDIGTLPIQLTQNHIIKESAPTVFETTGHSGLVYLGTGIRYRLDEPGLWALWRVTT